MIRFSEFEMDSITGEPVSFARFDGQVCLVVNVASECGLTPQYAGLQTLYQDNRDKGFTVLGFPCNQFGAQEPGTDAEVQEFASSRYNVDFPMFSKIEVNGDGACQLYQFLKQAQPGDGESPDIPWNFTKFLVDRQGQVIARFGPRVTPAEIAQVLPEHL